MRLAFVTTYPTMPCAIGIYSQKLLRALVAGDPDVRVTVLAEDQAPESEEPGIVVHPTYGRHEEYGEKIRAAAQAAQAQIVHFQYAPDLLGCDTRLPRLLAALREDGRKTVVTLHTVYGESRLKRLLPGLAPADFHREVGRVVDRIVVHHRHGMADLLAEQGLDPARLRVIPHGTDAMPTLDRTTSRRVLGLPESGLLFTFFGFIHIQKNVHTVVEAFTRVARELPETRLLIAGKPWGDRPYNAAYLALMKARIRLAGLRERVSFFDHYIPMEQVASLFSASDVLLLPHWQRYGSASGVFHQAIGAHKPIIVAKGPKFEDGLTRLQRVPVLTPEPLRIGAWAEAMRALARDAALREQARLILSDYAEETSWPRVAQAADVMYRELLNA